MKYLGRCSNILPIFTKPKISFVNGCATQKAIVDMKKLTSLLLLLIATFSICRGGEPVSGRYEIPVANYNISEIYLERMGYTTSFNPETNIPNWVAWVLDADKLVERESRSDKFTPDPDLNPKRAVNTKDYTGSGWDRGHMCPAGDNRWHWRAMDESFYMTNICPQHSNLNRGDWKELEEACRRWAAIEPLYIVCGPILYKTPKYGYIGNEHQVRVPDAFFKVILTGLKSGKPRAVGFIYKNEAGNFKRDKYVNSIDEVERITLLDFFSALPDDIETAIEAKYDLSQWQ